MKLVLRYPVWSGLAFEGLLVALFYVFPVNSCNAPPVGVAVLWLHYPAGFLVERVLGIDTSLLEALLVAALMIPVWIGALFLLRRVTGFDHARDASHGPKE